MGSIFFGHGVYVHFNYLAEFARKRVEIIRRSMSVSAGKESIFFLNSNISVGNIILCRKQHVARKLLVERVWFGIIFVEKSNFFY